MTEIKIQRKQLLDCLKRLRHAFARKNALPIFADYRFSLDGRIMKVYASDGELMATEAFTLPEEAISSEGEPRKGWCVNRHYIVPGLWSLDDQDITMQVTDYQLTIIHSYGRFKIPIEDTNEYPIVSMNFINKYGDPVEPYLLEFEAPGLKHWLEILRPQLEQNELRPVMNGIFFDCSPEGMSLCASDGHKLVRIRKNTISTKDKVGFIMPRKVAEILSGILPKTGMVNFFFTPYMNENFCKVQIKIQLEENTDHEFTIYFRGIEGRYPNYNSVIPNNYTDNISVDRLKLVKCLKRTKIFCDSSMMAKFRIDNGEITISAEDGDFETESTESIPCETHGTHELPVTIGLKTNFTLDLISKVTSNTILIRFMDAYRAIIIEPEPQPEAEDLTLLIMPIYIEN